MQRSTIDYGIDLGTTNSTIALLDGVEPVVIPNKVRSSVTPSAVWIDKRERLLVGEAAKRRSVVDTEDVALEFKLTMGLDEDGAMTFATSGRTMTPQALSAEVLKSLRDDVRTDKSEDIRAAAITVPAAFENSQTNATREAAEMAGLTLCPLLLEPVAASLAYGFQSEGSNVYWMVYDFGGGTFDAAVMRIRDGLIQVVNHDGDNFLGGKLLDWSIVEERLVPLLDREYNLPEFNRGNVRWRAALRRLKYEAESAKVEVCRTGETFEIIADELFEDADGNPVDVVYELTPDDVETLSRPLINRSLELTRNTLDGAGIGATDLDRILMVGGSTLNPWVRESVRDALGVELDFSIDPITVVARGAAIFAGTQPLGAEHRAPVADAGSDETVWPIQIEHTPVGNVEDPDIGGRVQPPAGASVAGCTIEIVDVQTEWRSGVMPLGDDGIFMTQLYADKQRRCEYRIELRDAKGNALVPEPAQISYTIGVIPEDPPATMTIGVGLANGEMLPYITKGTRLPTRKPIDHLTVSALRAGHAEDELRIPLLEGEHLRATRNHQIGWLVVTGADVSRDLPVGSAIEISVAMDRTQQVRVEAYVSSLDEDFQVEFNPRMQLGTLEDLTAQADAQRERLEKATERAAQSNEAEAGSLLERIGEQRQLDEVDSLKRAAQHDPDALAQLDRRLHELGSALDDVEDTLEWPELLEKADVSRADAERVVEQYGEARDADTLVPLKQGLDDAIAVRNPDLVRRKIRDLDFLWYEVVDRQPGFHVGRLEHLKEPAQRDRMINREQADRLFEQADRALANDDFETLRQSTRQLTLLLPRDAQADDADRRVGMTMAVDSR